MSLPFLYSYHRLLQRRWTVSGLCLVALFLMPLKEARGAGVDVEVPVAQYQLDCSTVFSCPESLLPRVSFWVEVFSRWDTQTAVLHDKDNPHRVFSTLQRRDGCRRPRAGDTLDREKKRVKRQLQRLATALEGNKALDARQQQLLQQFPTDDAGLIRATSERLRCQSGNRDRMLSALKSFQLYRPHILDALEAQNLTPELQYLPFVESAFNPNALSHVGAAGLWQIMPSTGKTLGLTVNNAVDDRYDPMRATDAAARYFRNSVDKLSATALENGHRVVAHELNPFVITSYNYGVRGMQRAIKQVGLDYERLLGEYKSPNFQVAVKNFYASFLAARHVAKNSERFFGNVQPDFSSRIHSYNTVRLDRGTSAKRLIQSLSLDRDDFETLNPALKSVVWKHKALIPADFEIRLPYREMGWDEALATLDRLPVEVEKPGFLYHRVRAGDSACKIAEKYRASCRALIKLNNLGRRATIYVGKRIKVPTNTGGIAVVSDPALDVETGFETYQVVAGDTACGIARRHKMSCDELLAINGLTRRSVIVTGQRLSILGSSQWHIVRAGQTACAIARSYRVECGRLLAVNQLSRQSIIRIGQRLRIPG